MYDYVKFSLTQPSTRTGEGARSRSQAGGWTFSVAGGCQSSAKEERSELRQAPVRRTKPPPLYEESGSRLSPRGRHPIATGSEHCASNAETLVRIPPHTQSPSRATQGKTLRQCRTYKPKPYVDSVRDKVLDYYLLSISLVIFKLFCLFGKGIDVQTT